MHWAGDTIVGIRLVSGREDAVGLDWRVSAEKVGVRTVFGLEGRHQSRRQTVWHLFPGRGLFGQSQCTDGN
jgi:hypothetical protein